MTVYLHIIGDGFDGNEYRVENIYATRELADLAVRSVLDGMKEWERKFHIDDHSVEEWDVLTEVPK